MDLSFAVWPWEVIYPLDVSVCQLIYKLRSIILIQMLVERVVEGNLHENPSLLSSDSEY